LNYRGLTKGTEERLFGELIPRRVLLWSKVHTKRLAKGSSNNLKIRRIPGGGRRRFGKYKSDYKAEGGEKSNMS